MQCNLGVSGAVMPCLDCTQFQGKKMTSCRQQSRTESLLVACNGTLIRGMNLPWTRGMEAFPMNTLLVLVGMAQQPDDHYQLQAFLAASKLFLQKSRFPLAACVHGLPCLEHPPDGGLHLQAAMSLLPDCSMIPFGPLR